MRDYEGYEDWQLVRAYRAGDDDAFVALVRRRSGLIAAICRRHSSLYAQDVVDETWYRVFSVIKAGDIPWNTAFGLWIWGITRNVLKAKPMRPGPGALPDELAADHEVDLGELLADAELHEALRVCLEELDPRLHEVYRLHYVEELPYVGVASRFGCAESYVRQKLVPKMKQLVGRCLKEKGFRGSNPEGN